MKKLRNIVLAASLLMGGWQAAMAEDLTIAGLGTLPLDSRISITDGKDNVICLKKKRRRRATERRQGHSCGACLPCRQA